MVKKKEIAKLIETFIEKKDISIKNANAIESILLDEFDDDEVQDMALMLASYRPGGGDYLYDEDDIINGLMKILHKFS